MGSWLRDYIPEVVRWMAPLQELVNSKTPWSPDSWQPRARVIGIAFRCSYICSSPSRSCAPLTLRGHLLS